MHGIKFPLVEVKHEGLQIVAEHMGLVYQPDGSYRAVAGGVCYVFSLPEEQRKGIETRHIYLALHDGTYSAMGVSEKLDGKANPLAVALGGIHFSGDEIEIMPGLASVMGECAPREDDEFLDGLLNALCLKND